MISNPSLDALNDNALLSRFGDLVRQDHEGSAQLLRHIDVIDRRKLWAKRGHPSMFDFLVARYHMSESTAAKRIGSARAASRFPVLFGMVARGEIHLSGIHRLRAHLTRENHEQVLALAKHKTMREIDEIVARLAPRPDVPTTLRALPNRSTTAPTLAAPAPPASALAAPAPATTRPTVATAPAAAPPPPRRDPDPSPLAPDRYRLQLTISQSTRDKLKQLQDLLAHQIPNGDPAVLLDRALDALLVQVHKRKTGISAKPQAAEPRAPKPRVPNAGPKQRPTPTGRRTRHLPAADRREVWQNDEGRCGFVGEDGHRCNETRGLEFAHLHPWAKGGANTAHNLGLRCPAHNALEADRDYGTGFMATRRQQKTLKVREPLARYVVRGAIQGSADRARGSMPPVSSRATAASPASTSSAAADMGLRCGRCLRCRSTNAAASRFPNAGRSRTRGDARAADRAALTGPLGWEGGDSGAGKGNSRVLELGGI